MGPENTLTSDTITATAEPAAVDRSPVPGGAPAAIAGAVVLACCNVLSSFAPHSGSTSDLVAWFGANAVLTEIVAAIGLVAAALLVPGIWAACHRLRARTPILAAVGAWAMATGYLMFTTLSIESLSLLASLSAGADPGLMANASDNHAPTTLTVLYFIFGLGALIGTIVIGVAILRQGGAVPRWAGWAMIISAPVRMIGLFTGLTLVGPPLASVLIAVGFVGVFFGRRGAAPGARP